MRDDGRKRVVIENVTPEINCGKFAIKRVVGELVKVTADIFTDGHDVISAVLLHKNIKSAEWSSSPMKYVLNDNWESNFTIGVLVNHTYTIEAWIDPFQTWYKDFKKKQKAGVATYIDIQFGLEIIKESQLLASGDASELFKKYIAALSKEKDNLSSLFSIIQDDELQMLINRFSVRKNIVRYEKELHINVDRKKALFSSWYEFFPRSASFDENRHGTFKDMEKLLPHIKNMGFDVLYFPPIHPIGKTKRKGKNNSMNPTETDTGSPWAIGSAEGGHKTVHPKLGSIDDFKHLINEAKALEIEIALDIAYQCSPDHPYVNEHPEWFKHRPDGSIQYAENPPKKYEDIYPINFETDVWEPLWDELKSIFIFWIEQGVTIFRIDNPHTKPFRFWQWVIQGVREKYPEILFLAEAFTRPKVMAQLAKAGFSQSYTYFTWRNTKSEITKYMNQLTSGELAEVFRPNFWPSTPDILPEYLQSGGRNAFIVRLVLAATLSSNFGIYGPAFELIDNIARDFGSEEYQNSEKYQIKNWDIKHPASLKGMITLLNQIRKDNPALQNFKNIKFHHIDNEQLLCFSRYTENNDNHILVVVNLDPHHKHSGYIGIPPEELHLGSEGTYQVYDLLGESWYIWSGEWNYVELDPNVLPAHIFKVRKKVRTERDFDYFL